MGVKGFKIANLQQHVCDSLTVSNGYQLQLLRIITDSVIISTFAVWIVLEYRVISGEHKRPVIG